MTSRAGTRVAVCQVAGRTLDQAPESLAACARLVGEAAAAGADVVVVPEGAYPGYVLGSAEAARAAIERGPHPIEAFAALAAEHAVTLVAGLVLDSPAGLHNAAVTFAPSGEVLGQAPKRFLWHFDNAWFVAGDDSPVVVTDVGRVGALVCADARLPEIARTLAVRGAGLVCDPTAWVTATPGAPSNIQPEFLVAARCIENGIVMACASKSGFEGPDVAYAGRSMVVDPDGVVLAEASVDGEEMVWADVDLDGLPRFPVERRPHECSDLLAAWAPLPPSADRVRVAAANTPGLVAPGRATGPGGPGGRSAAGERAGERDPAGAAAGRGAGFDPYALVVSPAGVETSGGPAPRVAVVDDMLAPEPARVAALRGAEVLAFVGDAPLVVLRARAAENRVFVVAAGVHTMVIAPSGAVIADAPRRGDRPFVAAADLLLAEAATKEMAPGSDVFAGRQPETYWDLVR